MPVFPYYSPKPISGRGKTPYQADSSSLHVRNNFHAFPVVSDAEYNGTISLQLRNFVGSSTNDTGSTMAEITPKMCVQYNGTSYPVTIGGTLADGVTLTGTVTINGISRETDPFIYVGFRAVGSSGVTANYCRSMETYNILNEGVSLGTDTGVDYADGLMPYGAKATATVSGGNIASGTVTRGGWNYSEAATVYAGEWGPDNVWYEKSVGSASVAGGEVTGITISSGTPPAGLDAWVSPELFIAFGRSGFTSSQGNVDGWNVSLMYGVPDRELEAVQTWGDSIMHGGGTGEKPLSNGAQGIYEIGMDNRVPFFNGGIGSATASAFGNLSNYARITLANSPIIWTKSIIAVGTNDLRNGRTLAQLVADYNTLRTTVKARGMKVMAATILPRTEDGSLTVPLQSQFENGGDAQQFNEKIRIGSEIPNDLGYVDGANYFSNPASRQEWGGPFVTDGTHPEGAGYGISRESEWTNQLDLR